MTKKTTRIRATIELCTKLKSFGEYGDSYEDIIWRLIEQYDKEPKNTKSWTNR